jgi:hypothetical protein
MGRRKKYGKDEGAGWVGRAKYGGSGVEKRRPWRDPALQGWSGGAAPRSVLEIEMITLASLFFRG